jgi:Toprim domain
MKGVHFISIKNVSPGRCLTLSESELELCRPIPFQDGRFLRAFCPFHGSDNQRSLRVKVENGNFRCFACEAWGYMAESHKQWRMNPRAPVNRATNVTPAPQKRENLEEVLHNYEDALPGSLGEEYLSLRGISLSLAKKHHLGYAARGKWIHAARDWKFGRVAVPHTNPQGELLNLYGRAIESTDTVPKEMRHDHLPGGKGYFNATALQGSGQIYVTEGPFDALSLIAAGIEPVVAIFGAAGWRWDWARQLSGLILAFDDDATGQNRWPEIARGGRLRGKKIEFVRPEAYGGYKDANEAWVAGSLILP